MFINRIQDKILIGTYGGGVHVFDEKTWSLRDFSHEELFLYGCILNIVDDAKGIYGLLLKVDFIRVPLKDMC